MPTTHDLMGWRMAGSDQDSRATWKAWVDAQFNAHPDAKQQDLAAAAKVGNSAVSKWRKGSNVADADAAGRAAVFFGRPPVEAMRAAGHHELLELLGVGETDETIKDPFVQEIMDWTHLSMKVRKALLERYHADAEAADEEAEMKRTAARNRARGDAALIRDSLHGEETQAS